MRIGIGITTHHRPEHLKLCLDVINSRICYSAGNNLSVYVHEDHHQRGIAFSKNMCLYHLKNCDYIFLFDDDCFPKKEGWIDFFINSGVNHALYMNNSYGLFAQNEQIAYYANASGVFMYLTKKVIETVGYFNPAYGRFGFEHAGYSKRIFNAGLSLTNFPVLHKTHEYLHALDIDGTEGYEYLNHVSTVTGEERSKCIAENDPIYIKETTSRQVYYEFKP
jgi:hypothetical protein